MRARAGKGEKPKQIDVDGETVVITRAHSSFFSLSLPLSRLPVVECTQTRILEATPRRVVVIDEKKEK